MSKDEEQKLDGARIDPMVVQAILELINGGPELPYVDPKDRFAACMPKDKKLGRIFIVSTVGDFEKDNNKPIWYDGK